MVGYALNKVKTLMLIDSEVSKHRSFFFNITYWNVHAEEAVFFSECRDPIYSRRQLQF